MKNNYVIIMAGGIGSRFWPVSRSERPKQFIDILGIGKSLLQMTYNRFVKIFPKENIYIVTNESYRALVREQLPELSDNQIMGEPSAKNTANCIAYASYKISKINPKANCVVAPSDHLILEEDDFISSIQAALKFTAKENALLTLGIMPNRPDTGYGYIQYVQESSKKKFFKVKTFTEKPSLEIAKTFIDSGDFLWNAGIFVWQVSAILESFEKYLPELNELFRSGLEYYNTDQEKNFIEKTYPVCTNISIDYGVLEKAENVYVLPSEFGWSDLGTWKSLYEIKEKDGDQNVAIGKRIMLHSTSGSMIFAPDDKLVVMNGVKDIIVVDSGDVLMICDKNREQEVRQMVTDVKQRFDDKYN